MFLARFGRVAGRKNGAISVSQAYGAGAVWFAGDSGLWWSRWAHTVTHLLAAALSAGRLAGRAGLADSNGMKFLSGLGFQKAAHATTKKF